MHPNFKPVENPALLPMVIPRRPIGISADFDGDAPNLISPYDPLHIWVSNYIMPGLRAIAMAFRELITSPSFKMAVNIARKRKRAKNQRRRRKSKANRKK